MLPERHVTHLDTIRALSPEARESRYLGIQGLMEELRKLQEPGLQPGEKPVIVSPGATVEWATGAGIIRYHLHPKDNAVEVCYVDPMGKESQHRTLKEEDDFRPIEKVLTVQIRHESER